MELSKIRSSSVSGNKNENNHISLFFIKPEHHRKGIGKKLFNYIMADNPALKMTVNSSSYAVPFYKSLSGLRKSAKQCINGLTFFPNEEIRCFHTPSFIFLFQEEDKATHKSSTFVPHEEISNCRMRTAGRYRHRSRYQRHFCLNMI